VLPSPGQGGGGCQGETRSQIQRRINGEWINEDGGGKENKNGRQKVNE